MSQVFSGDGVKIAGPVTLATTGDTTAVIGNFLNPPFQNAKALVFGAVTIAVGTGTTSIAAHVFRNPNAENLLVYSSGNVNVTAGAGVQISVFAIDPIPDGRPCQYALTAAPSGATGTGTIQVGNLITFLISG